MALVVTGHTPNFLPGVSVIQKVMSADAVIWMDKMQYVRHGYCNRNRFSDGTWLTVPVDERDDRAEFNAVRLAPNAPFQCRKIAKTLQHKMGEESASRFVDDLHTPYGLLVGLTVALLRSTIYRFGPMPEEHFQSHLAAGRYDEVSEGLAAMTAEIGGTVWLSGPSGRSYLDEAPFAARGIAVEYHEHDGPNPCALELLPAGAHSRVAA